MRLALSAVVAAALVVAGPAWFPAAAAAATADTVCAQGPYSSATGSGTVQGCTTRVSQTFSNGNEDGTSQRPRISEDASTVVFQSGSNNLVSDYQAGHGTDDYWARTADPAGTISLVDRAADGSMPNSVSGAGASFVDVSGDGRYVVFYSTATNLVAGRMTRAGSVFLRDMSAAGVHTIEVPQPATGTGEPNAYSIRPTISATPDAAGNYYVAYNAKATNLVSGATHVDDVYITQFNPSTFTVSRPMLLSHTLASATTPSNGQNDHAEISSDGTMIAWDSTATNLDPRTNGKSQVYESANPFLTAAVAPQLLSVSSDGTTAGNQPSTRPAIDRNGDEVAWESTASNLITGDTNGVLDCFLRGTTTGAVVGINTTIRVSLGYTGQQLTGASQRPNLDGAGDKVGFAANSSQVVKGDNNTQRDVFVRDLTTNTNYLIDACQSGGFGGTATPCPTPPPPVATSSSAGVTPLVRAGGQDLSSRPFLSDDGLTVVFLSGMADLVPDDTNAPTSTDDIFVRTFSSN